MAERAAQLDSTILLHGESGTGKEVFARFIHSHSQRAQQIFLPVNCAAIPRELMESEFFGYDKGAFTGSSREGKVGLFEMAHGGTSFLDEIGELNLPLQSKLLRVLETGEIKRVGGTSIKKVNVRIVAATNRDLKAEVAAGRFRQDLYYRLSAFSVELPPLRSCPEDICFLIDRLMEKIPQKYGVPPKSLSGEAFAKLLSYNWPGNIRELENVIERAVILTTDGLIRPGSPSARHAGPLRALLVAGDAARCA